VDVSWAVWAVTIAGLTLIFGLDILVMGRRPHVVGMREAAVSVVGYVALAALFGAGVWLVAGGRYGAEFFAGYITELSLSVDNLFVFVIIMSSFAVPQVYQLKVLQLGIIGALLLRAAFIAVGAVALSYFTWLFFGFGAFLIWTAWKLATGHGSESDPKDNKILQWLERRLPTTTDYHADKYVIRRHGRRVFTPLAVVIVAIFLIDLMFAMDSIPAIFGLTSEAYIVFTANAFALMGLRQMFFLLDGLLDRLIYLALGLAVVLGFIGVKLVLHAAHEYHLPVPQISTPVSLMVIVLTLFVTVAASLAKVRRSPEVYTTHDVTGRHHPPGAELDHLRAVGVHPETEPVAGAEHPGPAQPSSGDDDDPHPRAHLP
jgi:tellurite resistance protein TerC